MSSTMPPSDDTPPEDTTHDLSTLRGAMDDIIERAFNTVFTGTGRLYVAGHDSAFTGQVADLEAPTAAEDTTPVPAAAVPPPADAATGKHKPRFRLRRKMPDSTAPAPEPEPSDEPTPEVAITTVETAILPLSSLIAAASHDPNLYDMYLNVQPWVPGVDRRFYGQFTAPAADPLQHTEGYNRAWSQLLHQRMVRLDRNRYGGVTSEDYTPLFERLWREHPLASHAMEHPRDIMHVCGTSYDTLPIVAVVIRQADLVRRQETFDTMAVCPGRDPVSQRVMATFELLTDTPETVYGMVRRAATAALGEVVQSILHEQWPDNAS